MVVGAEAGAEAAEAETAVAMAMLAEARAARAAAAVAATAVRTAVAGVAVAEVAAVVGQTSWETNRRTNQLVPARASPSPHQHLDTSWPGTHPKWRPVLVRAHSSHGKMQSSRHIHSITHPSTHPYFYQSINPIFHLDPSSISIYLSLHRVYMHISLPRRAAP